MQQLKGSGELIILVMSFMYSRNIRGLSTVYLAK